MPMLRYLTTAVFLLITLSSQGQVPPGRGGATPAPIDGGASLLLVGGTSYIIRKLKQRRRAQ